MILLAALSRHDVDTLPKLSWALVANLQGKCYHHFTGKLVICLSILQSVACPSLLLLCSLSQAPLPTATIQVALVNRRCWCDSGGERKWESRFSFSPSALPWEASLSLLHPLPLCWMPPALWLPLVTPLPSLVLHLQGDSSFRLLLVSALPHCVLLSPQLLQLLNNQFSELVPTLLLNGLRWFLTSWLLEVSRLFL